MWKGYSPHSSIQYRPVDCITTRLGGGPLTASHLVDRRTAQSQDSSHQTRTKPRTAQMVMAPYWEPESTGTKKPNLSAGSAAGRYISLSE